MKKWLLGLFLLVLLPGTVFAQGGPDYTGQLDNTGVAVFGTADNSDLLTTLGVILRALLSVLGIVLLVLIIYAGVLWMTAGGNIQTVAKAKSILLNSIIGLVLILTSYAVSLFVANALSGL